MDIETIAGQVAAEYQMVFAGVEFDFALEVARRAVAAEREACAKMCEALTECCTLNSASHQTARLCAFEIRTRSNCEITGGR